MKKFKIKSFCKINLSLRVLKKLKNGYHSISSIITSCDLYDLISINKIKGKKDILTFSGKFKKGINKRSNTIRDTLYLLRKKNFLKKQAFKINVQKNIPHGSGLGGGSSNAANLINFLNLKLNLQLNKNQIKTLGSKIGFDVPISLERKNTFYNGKRNKILRFNEHLGLNMLIVYPNIICSTKKIYEKNKKFSFYEPKLSFNFKKKNQLIYNLINDHNDLEKTVINLYPKIGKIIDFIKTQDGCYFSRISGSGSACIGIFLNMKTAISAKNLIKLKFPKYWCVVSKSI